MRYLYKITNLINGKIYIGQTVDFKKRMQNHFGAFKGKNTAISLAIRKYGEINFKKEIIAECSCDVIDFMETRAIAHYNSIAPNGYNLESGGHINKTLHESTKKLFSEMRRGKKRKPHSVETRMKLSKSHKGRKNSEAHIEACRKAKIGTKRSASAIEKHRIKMIGHITSDETKRKIGDANRGRKFPPMSDALRKARGIKSKGHIVSAEARKKIGDANRGRPNFRKGVPLSEEHRNKCKQAAAKRKGVPMSEEQKIKLCEAWVRRKLRNKIETKPSII